MRGNSKNEALMFIPDRKEPWEAPAVSPHFFQAHGTHLDAAPNWEKRNDRYPSHLGDVVSTAAQPAVIVTGVQPYDKAGDFYDLVTVPNRYK